MNETSNTRPSGGKVKDAKGELADDAKDLKDQAASRAKDEAAARKQRVAEGAKAGSSALNKAAEELRGDDRAPSWIASGVEQVASSVSEFAETLESKDVGEVRREVTGFARSNPTAFLGACAAAGFAAARFLRAGAEEKGLVGQSGGSGGSQGGSSDRSASYKSYAAPSGVAQPGVAPVTARRTPSGIADPGNAA